MSTIIFALLTIYEFFYFLSFGGELSVILLMSFIAGLMLAYKVEKDQF